MSVLIPMGLIIALWFRFQTTVTLQTYPSMVVVLTTALVSWRYTSSNHKILYLHAPHLKYLRLIVMLFFF